MIQRSSRAISLVSSVTMVSGRSFVKEVTDAMVDEVIHGGRTPSASTAPIVPIGIVTAKCVMISSVKSVTWVGDFPSCRENCSSAAQYAVAGYAAAQMGSSDAF
mmetsp:Transcript_13234/g.27197  ORF Transcript_13234/g.27197 Transcript_13234/m.27197 type:complete len:104 (+) Transcript_13234:617-928(+)